MDWMKTDRTPALEFDRKLTYNALVHCGEIGPSRGGVEVERSGEMMERGLGHVI